MEALEQLWVQVGAAFTDLFSELRAKIAEHNDQPRILDSLRGFAAAIDWRVRPRNRHNRHWSVLACQACSKHSDRDKQGVNLGLLTQEPWIIGLLIAQALLLLAVLLSRRRPRVTMAIFFLAGTYLGVYVYYLLPLRHTLTLQRASELCWATRGYLPCSLVAARVLYHASRQRGLVSVRRAWLRDRV